MRHYHILPTLGFSILSTCILSIVLLRPTPIFADADEESVDLPEVSLPQDLTEIGLAALLDLDVSVASKVSQPSRQAPGIIEVITYEDIQKIGARDLIDILNTIPGLQFGHDIAGHVGLGVRGNWAFEGKALVMLDGIDFSKLSYGSFSFLNHIPIGSIERIEVIRGPGSAVYGGNAELAVISIITKEPKVVDGVQLESSYGLLNGDSKLDTDSFGRKNVSISAGKVYDKFSLVGHGYISKAQLGDRNYTSLSGETIDLDGNNDIDNFHGNIGFKAGNFSSRLIKDDFLTDNRTRLGYENLPDIFPPLSSNTETLIFENKYKSQFLDNTLRVTPRFVYTNQTDNGKDPGELTRIFEVDPTSDALYDIEIEIAEYLGGVEVDYLPTKELNLLFGWETSYQRLGTKEDPLGFSQMILDSDDAIRWMSNSAYYVQVMQTTEMGSFTIGSRYEYNSKVNGSFVPRITYTKAWNDYHFKLLAARAFRSPNLLTSANRLDPTNALQPENTNVWEAEAGMKLCRDDYLTATLFHIAIDDPILYVTLENDRQGNFNRSQTTGSRGIELAYRAKHQFGTARLSYSFYDSAETPDLPEYQVPTHRSRNLAFASHKITGYSIFDVTEDTAITPSLTYLSEVSGVTGFDPDNGFIYDDIDPKILANINLVSKNCGIVGLTCSLGVFNITNENSTFVQPYNGGHPPLPGQSREFVAKLGYAF